MHAALTSEFVLALTGPRQFAMRRVVRGDHALQDPELYFESIEELRQILTEKRMELMLAIAWHRPVSVRGLASRAGRDYKNVSSDITLLERLSLVRLDSQRVGDERRRRSYRTTRFT